MQGLPSHSEGRRLLLSDVSVTRLITHAEVHAAITGQQNAASRCVDALERKPNLWILGPIKNIRNLARWLGVGDGTAVVTVCRLYASGGFGAVYDHVSKKLPHRFECVPGTASAAFAAGSGQHQRNIAALLVADAQFALAEWAFRWNEREETTGAPGEPLGIDQPTGEDS